MNIGQHDPDVTKGLPWRTGRSPAAGAGPVPLVLLTGGLGSGKTTLLNALLRRPELASAAVLVNEFGEIGIDSEIIRQVSDDVVLVGAGCVCCSSNGDLREGLLSLFDERRRGRVDFRGPVIVETSGLSNPVPVMQLITSDPLLRQLVHLAAVITTVDAVNLQRQVGAIADIGEQIALADAIYISKTDLASAASQKAVLSDVARLNPLAACFEATSDGAAAIVGWLGADRRQKSSFSCSAAAEPVQRHADIRSFVIEAKGRIGMGDLESWLQQVVHAFGERLLRMKGIAWLAEGPMLVQSAGPLFHPLQDWRGPVEWGLTRLVCIGHGLDPEGLSRSLHEVCGLPKPAAEALPLDQSDSAASPDGAVRKLAAPNRHRASRAVERLVLAGQQPRTVWSCHNPWSVAASRVDSWALLDLAESEEIMAHITAAIGADVALVDSEIVTCAGAMSRDLPAPPLPIEPLAGAALVIHLGAPVTLTGSGASSLPERLCDGDIMVQPLSRGWSCSSNGNWTQIIFRYMPTTSHFVRDANHPANVTRLRHVPLANLATAPIWLVAGEDRGGNDYVAGFDNPRAAWLPA